MHNNLNLRVAKLLGWQSLFEREKALRSRAAKLCTVTIWIRNNMGMVTVSGRPFLSLSLFFRGWGPWRSISIPWIINNSTLHLERAKCGVQIHNPTSFFSFFSPCHGRSRKWIGKQDSIGKTELTQMGKMGLNLRNWVLFSNSSRYHCRHVPWQN